MGACRGSGGSATGAEPQGAASGKPFASFPPSQLHPEGEAVVTERDGEYHYERTVPYVDDVTLDFNSDEYKQALREFNVKVSLLSDGSLKAQAGALFPRARTFKTPEAFQAEVEKRLQAARSRYEREAERLKAGRLTHLEAENIKSIMRRMSKSMAVSRINRELREQALSYRYGLAAAEAAQARLEVAVDRARAWQRRQSR